MQYFIKTFGCQQNIADSERLASYYQARDYQKADSEGAADIVVVNTCIVKERAENKVYGYIKNLKANKKKNSDFKIIMTGCLAGAAIRDETGKTLAALKKRMPLVDEFLPIEEVGFEYVPERTDKNHAWVVISNGCNNFCTYCIVPFSRGREISRPYEDIVHEVEGLAEKGYKEITLLGQNVNSYGADIVDKAKKEGKPSFEFEGEKIQPVMISHLGRKRIPTLFPQLLERVAKTSGFEKVTIMSSNPWDFSDELINVYAQNKNINRTLHLPVQHGDNDILKKMNRWHTREQYIELIEKIRAKIPEIKFTTDLIVGFPGETEKAFQETVELAKKVNFEKAYVSQYSPRKGTAAETSFEDDVPHEIKVKRFHILDDLINKKAKEHIMVCEGT